LAASPLGRFQRALAWSLVVVAPLVAITLLEAFVWRDGVSLLVRWSVTIVVAVALVYFLLALRARLTTRPYDPYTGIRR